MKKITAVILFAIFGIGCLAQNKIQVILLAGQSNMAGRGIYANLSSEDKLRIDKVSKRVMVSSQGNSPYPLSYAKNKEHIKEFGPELFIGLTLAEANPQSEFLLIKRAVGGTSLHGAWSPDWTQEKALASERGESRQKMKLYAEHLKYIKDNLKTLTDQAKKYDIIGMAWMQGEKDTRLEISAVNYEKNLIRLIEAYRNDFDLQKMPFVYGQVNNPPRKKDFKQGVPAVRKAMEDVSTSLKNAKMIGTSQDNSWLDFPKHDDNVHYNADGQKRLGAAMGGALLEMIY